MGKECSDLRGHEFYQLTGFNARVYIQDSKASLFDDYIFS